MSDISQILSPITRADFNSASLNGTYQSLNGAGFEDTVKVLKIYNTSDVLVDLSFDGVTPHDVVPAGSAFILDMQTNRDYLGASWQGKQNQIVYGLGSAGTGTIYIVGYR